MVLFHYYSSLFYQDCLEKLQMLFSQFFKMESKNSKPEKEPDSSLATTSEELGLPRDNQELEQIAAAIGKEQFTLEAEAKK